MKEFTAIFTHNNEMPPRAQIWLKGFVYREFKQNILARAQWGVLQRYPSRAPRRGLCADAGLNPQGESRNPAFLACRGVFSVKAIQTFARESVHSLPPLRRSLLFRVQMSEVPQVFRHHNQMDQLFVNSFQTAAGGTQRQFDGRAGTRFHGRHLHAAADSRRLHPSVKLRANQVGISRRGVIAIAALRITAVMAVQSAFARRIFVIFQESTQRIRGGYRRAVLPGSQQCAVGQGSPGADGA